MGKGQGRQENEQTTPNLDDVMREGMEKFQGELEEAAQDPNRPGEVLGVQDAGPAEGGSAVAESPSGEEGEDEKALQQTQQKEGVQPAKKQFRFKSHEEAETGYREIQSKITRLEQSIADMKRDRTDAEAAEAAERAKEQAESEFTGKVAEFTEEALTAIDELDTEAEDYQKQVARIMAQKDAKVFSWFREKTGQATPVPAVEHTPPATETPAEEAGENELWQKVVAQAEEAGIPGEDDYFHAVCLTAPQVDADGNPVSFEDQVGWAIDKTKNYRESLRTQFEHRQREQAEQKGDRHQRQHLPMGSTPAAASPKQKRKVMSLNDAIEAAEQERRL